MQFQWLTNRFVPYILIQLDNKTFDEQKKRKSIADDISSLVRKELIDKDRRIFL